MDNTESPENDGQGGIIFHRGYLIQGENQTVEGGLTLVFPKNGKRYAVLQNTGPLQFCLCLFKDEKTFMKKERKNVKVTEMHFTANIKIHSLEMMMGRSGKPQNIFIIVHGGMPRYFKPVNGPHRFPRSKSSEILDWVSGFQKVANAIERRTSLNPSPRSSSEDDSQVTSRPTKPKRPDQDSGIDLTSRGSAMSTDQSEKGSAMLTDQSEKGEDSPINILPDVIEMDIPEEEEDSDVASPGHGVDDDDGPCRRSRMVLNQDRYEEQFVDAKPTTFPRTTTTKSKSKYLAIKEEHEQPKPEPKPRTLETVEEIRKNIVTMRLSTWPNRPESGEKDPFKDPNYQKLVVKTERQPSEPEGIELGDVPKVPPKSHSVAKWKTMNKVKDIAKQLEHNERPYGPTPDRSRISKKRTPSRPKRQSDVNDQDGDEEDDDRGVLTASNEDPEVEPPYDRLTKFRQLVKGEAVDEEEEEKEDEEVIEEEENDKRSSGESIPDTDRKRLYTNPNQNRRPLPKPNQEMDWKDVGNMAYEQSCRSCNVTVAQSDVKNALVLVKVNNEIMIAGWKKELSDRLHGKLHVGDVILQVNDIIINESHGPEFVHSLIGSSAKNEIPFVIKRLPHASIKELNKTASQTSWGLETHKNEIKGVSGAALDGGITPKTSAVLSSKQCEWVVTELAHQPIPLLKCAQDEVKQRLENLSNENNLVLIIQPRDLIIELREGLKRTKHPSDYYV